jgi:hypothetical protein
LEHELYCIVVCYLGFYWLDIFPNEFGFVHVIQASLHLPAIINPCAPYLERVPFSITYFLHVYSHHLRIIWEPSEIRSRLILYLTLFIEHLSVRMRNSAIGV